MCYCKNYFHAKHNISEEWPIFGEHVAPLCEPTPHTVEQEIFMTGKFHEFAALGGSRQEDFANLRLEDLEKFKNWLKANVTHYIFTTAIFCEPTDFRENRKIFLHAKISCFTVIMYYPQLMSARSHTLSNQKAVTFVWL